MKKNAFCRIISLFLCAFILFLSSCNGDLGISTSEVTNSGETQTDGFAGIGAVSKAYGGLFNGIKDINITIGEAELATVLDHADSGIYCECDVKIGNTVIQKAGIKPRGNTTYISELGNGRYSFKLKFNKYTKGQKLEGLDELELNNMSYDPSYIREYLAYTLFSLESGITAPLASFAKIYINGEYYGLYLMAESIDESFLKRCYGDADGNLYEADKGSAFLSDDTSSFNLKRGNDSSLSKIVKLYDAIVENQNVEGVLDTESVLRYAAVVALIGAQESYLGEKAESYYLYSDTEGVMHMIPRDFKLSFGTDPESRKTDYAIADSYITSSVKEPYFGLEPSDRPLVSSLLSDEEYYKEYLSYVKYYTDALSGMLEKLPELKEAIDEAVSADPRRLYDDSVYRSEYVDGDTLYGFIKARCENVNSQLAETEE